MITLDITQSNAMVHLLSVWSPVIKEAIRNKTEIIAVSPNTTQVYTCTARDARDPSSFSSGALLAMGISRYEIRNNSNTSPLIVTSSGFTPSSVIRTYNAQLVCPDDKLRVMLPKILQPDLDQLVRWACRAYRKQETYVVSGSAHLHPDITFIKRKRW